MELDTKNYGDHRVRSDGSVTPGHFNEKSRKTIHIESATLDSFMLQQPDSVTENINLIWVDIQGHEGKFFIDGREFLGSHRNIPVVMEFGPYGLERSGITKEDFCSIVKDLYAHFYDIREEYTVKHDISEIDEIYEKYRSPTGGSHLILLN